MSSFRSTLLSIIMSGLASGGVAVGCGPDPADKVPDDAADRYADAMCNTYERCGCMGEGFVDVAECRAESVQIFNTVEDWPGVQFDKSCFEDVLEHIVENKCGGPLSEDRESIPCEVFRATQPIGGDCMSEWTLEGPPGALSGGTCSGGGICVAGTCQRPPMPQVAIGDPCSLSLGVTCGQGNYCASDGRCRARVDEGAECDTPLACGGSELYCAGVTTEGGTMGTCAARIEEGGACDPDAVESCAPGLIGYCTAAGTCAASWPTICGAVTPAPDAYDPRDWIPLQ